ncbi:MAG: hypothetical protein ABIO70_36900 [Pseudomonadota bacterium]
MNHLVVMDTELVFRGSGWGGGLWAEEVPVYPEVTGRALGWEGQLRLDPSGPFWGWAGLTLSRSLRIDGDGGVYPGDYDQPVALTLLGAWKGPRSWQASARFRLTSGHPYTPQAGVYDPQSDLYLPWEGAVNSARFPWFHQLDVRVEKTWHPRRADVGLYLDVYNAYWARNPIIATYSYDYSRLVTTLYIPLIPSMGLVVDF